MITETGDARYRLAPLSGETEGVIKALIKAYNMRTVTLIRMIYSLSDRKIRSFANAFKLRKE